MSHPRSPLNPWPDAPGWVRIARHPSRFAPTLGSVRGAASPISAPANGLDTILSRLSARDLVYDDGILVGLSLSGRAFLTGAQALFEQAPIQAVRLVAIQPFLDELAESPWLNRLVELDLSGNRLGDDALIQFLTRIEAANLRNLKLSRNNLTNHSWQALADSSFFVRLHALDLGDNPLSVGTAPELLPLLQHLRLSGVISSPPQWKSFLERITVRRLESLALSGCRLGPRALDGIDPESYLVNWQSLDLSFNQLGQLPRSRGPHYLRELNLAGNRLTDADVRTLAQMRLHTLECLDLSVNLVTEASLPILADRSAFPKLVLLRLADCPLLPGNRIQFWRERLPEGLLLR